MHFQALKIISLCGWEPRLLPYVVNYKDQTISNGHSLSTIDIYASASDENVELDKCPITDDVKYDPSSIVLDCRLCGASIGLWAFSSASLPIEFLRLVGLPETIGNGDNTTDPSSGNHVETAKICATSLTALSRI